MRQRISYTFTVIHYRYIYNSLLIVFYVKSILADIDKIHGRYVAGKSNTVCPVLKSFFNKNTQLPPHLTVKSVIPIHIVPGIERTRMVF